jgi:hypothetical protein
LTLFQHSHDLLLLRFGLRRSRSTPSRVQSRQEQRSRASLGSKRGVRSGLQESAYGLGATRPYRPMQRSGSGLVEGVWIGPRRDEPTDRSRLRSRIPPSRPRLSRGGAVQRFIAQPISCANVCSRLQQLSRDFCPVCGGRDVQCRVALPDVPANLINEVRLRGLPGCSLLKTRARQLGSCVEHL